LIFGLYILKGIKKTAKNGRFERKTEVLLAEKGGFFSKNMVKCGFNQCLDFVVFFCGEKGVYPVIVQADYYSTNQNMDIRRAK